MKKLLANILKERTETIKYREIRKQLMIQAQNRKNSFLRLYIQQDTILRLQNEGLTVEKINDGMEKYKISW